ncbi:phosphatase PAP2 family protein [Nocardioides mangrovicus]|uniref:Phosphatase PAP2 family protein n=2 Tax=Nocardioides mangrovicus TaxID=2478913 RepID=A0A3L8P078_9ACTN|nr:phosphatase PAP2 family protein [Nocardioides mangrovicus]
MTAYTVVTAGLLVWKNHRRAAVWTVLVMVVSTLLVDVLKPLVGRARPVWDDPITTLRSLSFPSGHAAGVAAAACVTCVLAMMLVRRRNLRRLLVGAAVTVAVLVGLDRVLLGVHNVSDVAGGWLLGVGVGLTVLTVYDPRPRSSALTTEPLPEVYRREARQLAVVLNPAKVDDPGAFRAMVEESAAAAGFADVFWYETTVEDPGESQAHAAAVGGADLVITCGGDGTVRAVCEELAGTGVPIGIVPAGTGNLLARNLALPLYLRAAVDVALNGQDRAIDMVEVSGDEMPDSTYLVMAGMGFDAAIMEGVNEDFKARVGWVAYVVSALRSLMFPAVRVEISVDGGEFTRHRARTIVVGNVGFLQGGMPLIPDAEIDDGLIDVVLLYPRRFLSWLPLAVRVLSRNRRTDELVTRMRGKEVVVRAAGEQPRQLDGDLVAPGKELRCRCVHGRLLVRVPR